MSRLLRRCPRAVLREQGGDLYVYGPPFGLARASIGSTTPLWRFAETEKPSNRYCGREASLADVSGQATSTATPASQGRPARFSVPRKLLVATQGLCRVPDGSPGT